MSMNSLVHSEGFRLSDDMKEKAIVKVGRLEPFAPRILRARITIRLASPRPSKQQFEATMLMELPGNDISAMQKASEPLEAVDLLVDKMGQLMRKRKTAKMSQRTRGVTSLRVAPAM